MNRYADVILPLAVEETFTYLIPDELREQVQAGVRVVVSLGPRKYYTGIVYRTHDMKPSYRLKPLVSVKDTAPVVTAMQLRFWEWLAAYYLCGIGEVMNAAIPAALKSKGFSGLLQERYSTKKEAHILLSESLSEEASLHTALDALKRAKGQYQALIRLAELTDANAVKTIPKGRFIQSGYGSAVVLRELEKKGLIRTIEIDISRYDTAETAVAALPVLTEAQQKAFTETQTSFSEHKPVLLHGVTGSGKTELYIHLIREALDAGKDALYLLPEIALTTQLIERLQNYFGNRVIVYHSRFSDNMRAECYLTLLEKERGPLLILGVRSSLLLPYRDLGVIIIDEEHENSYKQYDPAPRYHARDSALMLARLYDASVVLGSATPSVESYYNAHTGKYGWVALPERYGGAALPTVVVTDMARAAKRGEKTSHFSHALLHEIDRALKHGEQVILFQNRRGFSPYIECGACTAIPGCPHCNVSLTYHKQDESLVCHYCGYTIRRPRVCPECGSEDLQTRGFGTEKIEDELQKIFPEARIARLDLDSTRSVNAYTRIVSAFDAGRTDILVGTQMVTKGFDFDRVTVVGVLNADNLLNFPDFRAEERAFQLMMQVSGRAGRREKEGKVIIQTFQPDHPVLAQVKSGEYEAMFRTQITGRQRFLYPPFCRLIRFTLKHKQKAVLDQGAKLFGEQMRKIFGRRLLGPEAPLVDRINNDHLTVFLLKIEKEKSFAEAKTLAVQVIRQIAGTTGLATLAIVADVDPQ